MTDAREATSCSTRAVRATIPGRATGGWNFDSGSAKPSFDAISRFLPDVT